MIFSEIPYQFCYPLFKPQGDLYLFNPIQKILQQKFHAWTNSWQWRGVAIMARYACTVYIGKH